MIIKIATTTICDGPTRNQDASGGPSDLEIDSETHAQVARYLRAANAKPIDRGNALHAVRFGVSRLCASAAAAHEWFLNHIATVPRKGTLTLEQGETAITMDDAHLVIRGRVRGLTVFLSYTIQAGAITIPEE